MKKFKQAFSEKELEELGERLGFCKRRRTVTPYRLVIALLESLSTGRIETLADILRTFNGLHGESVQYKPFHNQLAKEKFPELMMALCKRLMEKLSDEALRFNDESPFSRFSHISLHDGSSFALKPALHTIFPGRFNKVSPAAVELHVTMDLFTETPQTIILTPDTNSEVHYAPEAETISGGLLMADRMFFIKHYLAEIAKQGGHYLVKAKGTLNPIINRAYRKDGREIKTWRGKRLKDVKSQFGRYKTVDLDVNWKGKAYTLDARLVMTWNKEKKRPRYLVTNLPRDDFSVEQVCDAYRLRWQVELMFKEWKSYANLHAFGTNKAPIAEGLIWASLCAAILKRFLAYAAQRVHQVAISTRKASMSLRFVLTDIFRALLHHGRKLKCAMTRALQHLACNAKRAHPKRDKVTGRSKLKLDPVFG